MQAECSVDLTQLVILVYTVARITRVHSACMLPMCSVDLTHLGVYIINCFNHGSSIWVQSQCKVHLTHLVIYRGITSIKTLDYACMLSVPLT